MNTKKAIVAAIAVVMCAGVAVARPHGGHGGGPRHGGHRGGPPPVMHHARPYHGGGYRHHSHHHGGSGFWGHGGRNFWGGLVGGIVGGVVYDAVTAPVRITDTVVTGTGAVVASPATVYTTPSYRVQNVWVEGRYENRVQANGLVVRVWVPGHYEQTTVYY